MKLPASLTAPTLLTLLVFLSMTSPSFSQEAGTEESAGTDGWLVEALAREVTTPPPLSKLNIHETFDLEVPAKLTSQKMTEGTHDVQFEFGTSTPARCFFWEQELDLASALNLQTDAIFGTLANRLEAKQLFGLNAGAVAGRPYLAADWIFRLGSESGGLVGLLKVKIARKRGHTLLCLHDEPGYMASYSRFFEALVGSLEFRKTDNLPPEPDYREISVTRINGQIVGLEELSLLFYEDGIEEFSLQSTLMPLDKQTLQAADEAEVVSATPNGRVVSYVTAGSGSGEASQITLKAGEGETWTVTGTLDGKQLNSTFESAPPLSGYGLMLAAREMFAQPAGQRKISFLQWFPSSTTTAFETSSFNIGEGDGAPYEGVAQLGELGLKMVLNADGTFQKAESADPSVPVSMERVFFEGTLP